MVRARHKLAAILLLSWASVDICVPKLCAIDRQENLPVNAAVETSKSTSADAASIPQQKHKGDGPVDDDCFCCSSHVAPATHYALAETTLSTPAVLFLIETHTEDWVPLLYHPPRS